MEEARALLDQLMGRDRNATAQSKGSEKKINWFTQEQYCPYYLVDFCPNELFVNTRAYMGSCGKEHCEYTKFQFDQMEDGREKQAIMDRYERKLLSYCEYMETQLAQKIRRAKARVTTEIPDIEVPAQNVEKIEELKSRIRNMVKDAEGLAEQGRLIESEKKMAQTDPLNDKIRELSGEKYLNMTRTEFVCDVCGCLVTLNENDSRITLETHEHARGKQHQGWAKIKETSKLLREKFASNRGGHTSSPREAPRERRPVEPRSPPPAAPPQPTDPPVAESPKPTNGTEEQRKTADYKCDVEDWRAHLSKMRSKKSKHRHNSSEKSRRHHRSRSRDRRDRSRE